MDSDDDTTPGPRTIKSATSLQKYFNESDRLLPASVDVVEGFTGWKEQESLKTSSRLLLVGVQNNQMVRMTDETGGDFEESLPFQRCRFMLLETDKAWLHNKVFESVSSVLRLPAEQRPKYLRTQRGMLFSAEEGLSTDEILFVTDELAMNDDGAECAVWFRLAAAERGLTVDKRKKTKVLIPIADQLGSGASFSTILDPRKYDLQQLVDMVGDGDLAFPIRVKPVDIQQNGEGTARVGLGLPNYTIVGLSDAKWLVGIELEDSSFFRVPLAMAERIQVKQSQLRSSDLKLCMHAVLESLADTDLRVIGPQTEGSLSSKCTTPNTPILPKRFPPEGMQSEAGTESKSAGATGQAKSQTLPAGTERGTSAAAGHEKSAAMLRSQSVHGHPRSLERSRSAGQLRHTGSLRRFSTPAVVVSSREVGPRNSPATLTEEPSPMSLHVAGTAATSAAPLTGPAHWSVTRVIKELSDLKLGQYAAQFQSEGVSGELLLQLDDAMLRDDFGMSNRFHRMKLTSFVKKVQS